MGNNLKYPVLSSLVALNFIMGKGFGVRILAFETRSWSDTILWSMLAAGNSYGWKLHFWKNQQFLLSKNIKNLLGKLNWSDNCTWIKNCILVISKNYTIMFKYCPILSKKLFLKWKYPHISATSDQLCIWICYLFFSTNFAKVSVLGVDSIWGDCTFIPADWGS